MTMMRKKNTFHSSGTTSTWRRIGSLCAIAVFWVMGFCAVAWAGTARPNYSAVLAKDSFFPKAVTQFTCKDTVYLQFQWQGLEEGDHSLMALWFNPQGENVDEFRQSFIAVKGGNVQNWVALKFTNIHKKNGIFGFGESPLVGRWTVKYFLDGDFLDEKTFTVACD